ncbi:MAG: hypothetical protein R3B90_21830 [Planctomycetaceae bacterium]
MGDAKRQQRLTGLDDEPVVIRRKRNTLRGRNVRRELTARTAAGAIGAIEPGMELYCLTMGKFSLIDVIEHVLASTGPADVVVSTWTAAAADIGFANRLLVDGRLLSLRFVVDYSFPFRQPAYCAALREAFGDDAIRATKNHAKFVLIRNAEWSIVVRTSMNLNECRRLESLEVSDDAELAAWLSDVVDRLFAAETGVESIERGAGEHLEKFGHAWDDGDAGATEDERKRFFGDGPTAIDLRRQGLARRC